MEEQFFLNYLNHCEKAQEQAMEKREKSPQRDSRPKIDKERDLRVRDPPNDLRERRRSRSPPHRVDFNKRPRSPPRRGPWEGGDDRRQMNPRGGRGGGFDSWNGRGGGGVPRGGRAKFQRTEFDHPPELRV